MLKITTEVTDNTMLFNDDYFSLYTQKDYLTDFEIECLAEIDNSEYLGNGDIKTKFGLTKIFNISTGAKTLLNIVNHPDTIFSVIECGPNVLEKIFRLAQVQDITINMQWMMLPTNLETITKVVINDCDINGWKEYMDWWDNYEDSTNF